MKNFIFTLTLLISLILVAPLTGCDKEMTGYGKYAIAFNSNKPTDTTVEIFLDGQSMGVFNVKSGDASGLDNGDDFDNAHLLNNVFIIEKVAQGEHRIKFSYEDGVEQEVGKFFIQQDSRIVQTISLQ